MKSELPRPRDGMQRPLPFVEVAMIQDLTFRHLLVPAVLLCTLVACSASFATSHSASKEGAEAPQLQNFSKAEVDFIIEKLGPYVKSFDKSIGIDENRDAGKNIHVKRGKTVHIWGNGRAGFVPGVSFSSTYRREFRRDFDGDGDMETVFTVQESAGGTAAWNVLYSLEQTKRGTMKLHRLNSLRSVDDECPCPSPLRCPDSSILNLERVEKGSIVVLTECWKMRRETYDYFGGQSVEIEEHDPEFVLVAYRYRQGKLQRKSVRVIERQSGD
ncbi:MAG: hypothetical protein KJ626_02755 [Verrucomicrobia bacterium]|nr:hypothetical protein [Verrucomicrobiota bacterium]